MRALKIAGVVAVALWMAWITLRVELALRAADDACFYAYLAYDATQTLRQHDAPQCAAGIQ